MDKKIHLNIKGMTCASCVARIEKVLKKDAGVIKATVNLATERAQVDYHDDLLDFKKIIALVEKAGYEASLVKKSDNEEKEKELKKNKFIILISSLLTLPLLLPMFMEPFGLHLMPSPTIQLILATPVQFIIGARFYKSGWSALKAKTGNMELLVAIGTSAAYGLSLYLMNKHSAHGVPHLYFEGSAVIITLVLLGKYFEARAKLQTSFAIKALQKLQPQTARVKTELGEEMLAIEALKVNDQFIVRPGERIALDGEIIEGNTQIDESLVTGESLPVEKKLGDKVIGGSINGHGVLLIKVTATGTETVLARIIRLIEEAQTVKAPIQRLVDKVSSYFVPTVIMISFMTFLITGFYTSNWEQAIIHAVAVLVIACPCALGLATPTSIMVGTGVAAKAGILIKDAESLEITHSITTVVFDKTGTLTEGKPSLSFMESFGPPEDELLKIISSIQAGSEHPLGKAIMEDANKKSIKPMKAENIKAIPGKGLQGNVGGKIYFIGSKKLAHELGLLNPKILMLSEEREHNGETVSFLMDEKDILGIFTFKDGLKLSSLEAISKLKKLGIKTVMLTGDNYGSAELVAKSLGIEQFAAEVLPQDKTKFVQNLKEKGEIVAMIGDGINDAPALAMAHVGMAMASGTDVAMHSAGITLMRNNPLMILDAIQISRKTYTKIKENLFWAFFYNVIGIPLAALGYLNPMIAGAAMALSSVSVVTNALLLKRWKPSTNTIKT